MDSPISLRSGVFVSEEAEGEYLNIVMILCHRRCQLSTIIYLNLLNPQASKSENMRADKSFFMVFNCVLSLLTHALLTSVGEMKLRIFWLWLASRDARWGFIIYSNCGYFRMKPVLMSDYFITMFLSTNIFYSILLHIMYKFHYIWSTLSDLRQCCININLLIENKKSDLFIRYQ